MWTQQPIQYPGKKYKLKYPQVFNSKSPKVIGILHGPAPKILSFQSHAWRQSVAINFCDSPISYRSYLWYLGLYVGLLTQQITLYICALLWFDHCSYYQSNAQRGFFIWSWNNIPTNAKKENIMHITLQWASSKSFIRILRRGILPLSGWKGLGFFSPKDAFCNLFKNIFFPHNWQPGALHWWVIIR